MMTRSQGRSRNATVDSAEPSEESPGVGPSAQLIEHAPNNSGGTSLQTQTLSNNSTSLEERLTSLHNLVTEYGHRLDQYGQAQQLQLPLGNAGPTPAAPVRPQLPQEDVLAQLLQGQSAPVAAHVAPAVRAKTFRPDQMRKYKGKSPREHSDWFSECEIVFMRSPEYFPNDRMKILYCTASLEGDPGHAWKAHSGINTGDCSVLDRTTFAQFKEFLLNLVADPGNRMLLAYEQWHDAKQKPDQGVTAFKAELEGYEDHLDKFTEAHKANFFLAKLKPSLKNAILNTGIVPKTREDMLAQAIMAENTLERQRKAGTSTKPFKSNQTKTKPQENRVSKPEKKKSAKAARQIISNNREWKEAKTSTTVNPEHKDDTCHLCSKMGHWANECPEKHSVGAVVGEVQSKNSGAPHEPRRRSKGKDR